MRSLLLQTMKFLSVGCTGLFVNYFVSLFFFNVLNFNFFSSTVMGIIFSIFSNFFLNKIWTFKDSNFLLKYVLKQLVAFFLISSLGILIQLSLVYLLTENGVPYYKSLAFSVLLAAVGNFILNKKITFDRKLWNK